MHQKRSPVREKKKCIVAFRPLRKVDPAPPRWRQVMHDERDDVNDDDGDTASYYGPVDDPEEVSTNVILLVFTRLARVVGCQIFSGRPV